MSECVSLYVRIILCHTGGEELKARRAAKLRVLVNGLMANFEFQSFWAKKVDFIFHGAPILPRSILKFCQHASNLPNAKT